MSNLTRAAAMLRVAVVADEILTDKVEVATAAAATRA